MNMAGHAVRLYLISNYQCSIIANFGIYFLLFQKIYRNFSFLFLSQACNLAAWHILWSHFTWIRLLFPEIKMPASSPNKKGNFGFWTAKLGSVGTTALIRLAQNGRVRPRVAGVIKILFSCWSARQINSISSKWQHFAEKRVTSDCSFPVKYSIDFKTRTLELHWD